MNKRQIDKYYGTDKILEDRTTSDARKLELMQEALGKYAERFELLEQLPAMLEEIIRSHEVKQNVSYATNEADRIKGVIRHYQDTASHALAGAEAFRDRTVIWLRAMLICLDSVSSAGTHGEKNARLRGAIEVVERFVAAIQDEKFDLTRVYWNWDRGFNSFKSDYPVRDLLESNRNLKYELEQANKQIEKLYKKLEGPTDDAITEQP